jgi:hypothetical protein
MMKRIVSQESRKHLRVVEFQLRVWYVINSVAWEAI